MNHGFLERGGLWVAGQGALMIAVGLLGFLFRGTWESGAALIVGGLLAACAAVCGLAGAVALGRNLTPFPRPGASTCLVRTGIYRYLRHPLYTAVMSAAFAWGALWQSWPSLLAAVVLAFFFDGKARREERWLRQRFADYADYQEQTRRFVPGVY
jgi:protein-S-isoprenylcysteine O-methyltransferase Ste14